MTLRAEWTKLIALRGTRWSLLALLVLTVLLTLLVTSSSSTSGGCPDSGCDDDLVQFLLSGVYFGQIAAAWFGVSALGAEFGTGMIRTTFTATPRRIEVVAAKAAVVGGLVLAVGLVATFAAFVIARPLLAGGGYTEANGYPTPSFDDFVTWRAVVGSAVYLALIALLSLGATALLRGTAVAISVVMTVLWLPLILINLLPMDLALKVGRLCPMFAGLSIQRTVERTDSFPIAPGAGLALLAAYALAALASGALLITRRDP